MGLLDDYQNAQNDSDSENTGLERASLRRKRAETERQIAILDSDLKKTIREIEEMDVMKRKFKKEEERIRIDRAELDKNLEKLENNQMLLEEEIRGLKKRLKTLQ